VRFLRLILNPKTLKTIVAVIGLLLTYRYAESYLGTGSPQILSPLQFGVIVLVVLSAYVRFMIQEIQFDRTDSEKS
jgi:hypothetical protein